MGNDPIRQSHSSVAMFDVDGKEQRNDETWGSPHELRSSFFPHRLTRENSIGSGVRRKQFNYYCKVNKGVDNDLQIFQFPAYTSVTDRGTATIRHPNGGNPSARKTKNEHVPRTSSRKIPRAATFDIISSASYSSSGE
jgi:hypothetical protein